MLPTRTVLVSLAASAALAGGVVSVPEHASAHASVASKAAPVRVTIVDDAYMPMNRTVKLGKTVTWTWRKGNRDSHSVTITGPKNSSSAIKRSGTYSVKFTKVGTYHVQCKVHSAYMTMTIKVVR